MYCNNSTCRHIQKHLREVTGESEQSQDVEDVAAGDNAKGDFFISLFHICYFYVWMSKILNDLFIHTVNDLTNAPSLANASYPLKAPGVV